MRGKYKREEESMFEVSAMLLERKELVRGWVGCTVRCRPRRGSEATSQAEHEVEGRLLLDVVVRESAAVLELLASEDEALLIGRNTFLVLDLSLHVVNGVGGLDLKGDSLAGKGLNEDLHSFVFNYKVKISVAFYTPSNQLK